ncbi:MAG: hypothetical protein AB7R89_23025 [Dehalococcoidia bacterium]
MGSLTIGVDIGQKVDPTAICVAEQDERTERDQAPPAMHHLIRHMERLPLGTPYPAVSHRIAVICRGVFERTGTRPDLHLDATGVGQPVVDELVALRPAVQRVIACYFTHGDRRTEERSRVTIGKAWLVSRLQALLQGGRVHLPRQLAEAEALTRELLDYEIRVSEDANDKYGAFKVGTHDDLVTALGLATQTDRRPMRLTLI